MILQLKLFRPWSILFTLRSWSRDYLCIFRLRGARDLSWLKGLSASTRRRPKEELHSWESPLSSFSQTALPSQRVKEAGRNLKLVADTEDSKGLGYSRKTPGSSTHGAAPQARINQELGWSLHQWAGQSLTDSTHSHSSPCSAKFCCAI